MAASGTNVRGPADRSACFGICHQANLEFMARAVVEQDGVLYPDTLVGTDSYTTMIGLGVLGSGVGGIEAEAANRSTC